MQNALLTSTKTRGVMDPTRAVECRFHRNKQSNLFEEQLLQPKLGNEIH